MLETRYPFSIISYWKRLHEGEDVKILTHRKSVYADAKKRQPARWSDETRDWNPVQTVLLNPEKVEASAEEIIEEVA
jgi:hypothetical protein